MRNKIIFLTDYNNNFGSKQNDIPYKSGLDFSILTQCFNKYNFDITFINMSNALIIKNIENKLILYTSSEDKGYHYKSYIEDVILYLQESGARLLPNYNYLRANNNKVYMELFRKTKGHLWGDKLSSWAFGTLEEMKEKIDEFNFPIVIKTASGALSRGVSLAKNRKELISQVKSISKTSYFFEDIKDSLRPFKHKGYKKASNYRNKFILQSFIPNLKNDWKILIFGDKYFVLTRHVRENDFRASGSHVNYLAGSKAIIPSGLLDFARNVCDAMNVPHLSIDVVFDGVDFHLIEFQAVYFGTSTINMCDVYFKKEDDNWIPTAIESTTEEIYVESVTYFLNKSNA